MRLTKTASVFAALLVAATACCTSFAASPAHAVEPDEILKDANLEKRARELSKELRCLVCQNQSIDDSNAPLARDLRILVRERLKEGDSDQEVLAFAVERYGEFVLLRPPFALHTLLLWLTPLAALAAAVFMVRKTLMAPVGPREDVASPAPLSDEEQEKLNHILNQKGNDLSGDGKSA